VFCSSDALSSGICLVQGSQSGSRRSELIYRAATVEEAEHQFSEFAATWDARYPSIAKSWKANWARIVPMFGTPFEIRRAVYTTNAIESLNMSLRKVIKTRASFPNDDAAFKLLYLAPAKHRQKVDDAIPELESSDAGLFDHL